MTVTVGRVKRRRRPHESPSCACTGCKAYDDAASNVLSLEQPPASLTIDEILAIINDMGGSSADP